MQNLHSGTAMKMKMMMTKDSEWLTPEQLEMIKPALDEFKADIKAAEAEFHSAFRAIKDEYKDALEELRELKKGPEGQDVKEELAALKDQNAL
jgi:pyruvate-formate lyase-activating enzyme